MSDLLALGASGLRTYQTAISTTSENIANANTPGYTRRSAAVTEIPATWGVKAGGNGSFVSGITRASDQFRVADVRVAAGDLAKSQTSVVWMSQVEAALTNNQISDRMTAFFNAAKAVAADPAATAPRAVMLESAQSIAVAFAGTGNALTSAANDLAASGADAARDLTDLAGSLDRINRQVAQSTEGTSVRASLLDQRDQILEQMSGLVDIDVQVDNLNRATVRVGGSNGPVLVDPAGTSAVTFAVNDTGASTFSVHRGGAAQAVTPHAGSFAGIADGAQRIAAARETLDDLATSFVDGINAAQANGRTLDNTPGTAMFAAGDPPSQVTVTLTDPRGIAAAAVGEGPRGNGNMTALETLRTSAGYESGLETLTTTNAAALAARKDVVSAQTAIRDSAVAARDSVGGVNLDEEAVDLIRFQQAYQASTRVIQVARETLQAIFDIT